MIFRRQLEIAFGNRQMPTKLIDDRDPVTPEQKDAIRFDGLNWRDITWNCWENYGDAIYAFTPEAFAYYLPSILIISNQHADKWFAPADALVQVLDRSPMIECWDLFITTRLIGLKYAEYEVMKEWLLSLSGHKGAEAEDAIGRALETVDLLQRETEKSRALMNAKRI